MAILREAIETYIAAKDGNRPHLIADAFEPDAILQMSVHTDAVAFPTLTEGAGEIARVLCSDFGRRYENVYTFCVGTPPSDELASFECDWLVCMSEKEGGTTRVGWGRYRWTRKPSGHVAHLHIMIEMMQVLPAHRAAEVFAWATRLPYPWCPVQALPALVPSDMPPASLPTWLRDDADARDMMHALVGRHRG